MAPDQTADPTPTDGGADTDPAVEVLTPASSNKYHALSCGQIVNPDEADRLTLADAKEQGLIGAACCTPGGIEWEQMLADQQQKIDALDTPDPNPDYQPVGQERLVLAIMRDEGRAPSRLIRMRGGFDAQRVTEITGNLVDEKWLARVRRPDENEYGNITQVHAFYEYNAPEDYDPFAPPHENGEGAES